MSPVVLVLQPPLCGTRSHLAFATLPLPIPSIVFLKLTASSRLSAPPSGSPKCLRLGLWLTLCTLKIDLLTYLLTYQHARSQYFPQAPGRDNDSDVRHELTEEGQKRSPETCPAVIDKQTDGAGSY